MAIRVLLADDHSVVRRGLRMFRVSIPKLEVVGEAATAWMLYAWSGRTA
jgi:DNA-binding NarL/FixJ family response regulator